MNTVLWFSGGKDSMACLYLYRESLKEITVLFANTGKYYPELLETVNKAKAMCPHWVEVKTDREKQWAEHGLPSDVVPIDWTQLGQQFTGIKPVMIQSYLGCCYMNISGPLMAKTLELGATTVIRGQRKDEEHKAPNGIVNGVTFIHPIENWTKEEVLSYLKTQMELPAHYTLEHSSMDCFDCTAYARHSVDRAQYMKERHPDLYEQYMSRMEALSDALSEPLADYGRIYAIQ